MHGHTNDKFKIEFYSTPSSYFTQPPVLLVRVMQIINTLSDTECTIFVKPGDTNSYHLTLKGEVED